MQSIKSHYYSWLQKLYFKAKDLETKKEMVTIYFKIAVNLIGNFSYGNQMYISICLFPVNQAFHFCL